MDVSDVQQQLRELELAVSPALWTGNTTKAQNILSNSHRLRHFRVAEALHLDKSCALLLSSGSSLRVYVRRGGKIQKAGGDQADEAEPAPLLAPEALADALMTEDVLEDVLAKEVLFPRTACPPPLLPPPPNHLVAGEAVAVDRLSEGKYRVITSWCAQGVAVRLADTVRGTDAATSAGGGAGSRENLVAELRDAMRTVKAGLREVVRVLVHPGGKLDTLGPKKKKANVPRGQVSESTWRVALLKFGRKRLRGRFLEFLASRPAGGAAGGAAVEVWQEETGGSTCRHCRWPLYHRRCWHDGGHYCPHVVDFSCACGRKWTTSRGLWSRADWRFLDNFCGGCGAVGVPGWWELLEVGREGEEAGSKRGGAHHLRELCEGCRRWGDCGGYFVGVEVLGLALEFLALRRGAGDAPLPPIQNLVVIHIAGMEVDSVERRRRAERQKVEVRRQEAQQAEEERKRAARARKRTAAAPTPNRMLNPPPYSVCGPSAHQHPPPSSLSYPVHQHPPPSSLSYPVHQHPPPSSLFYPVHQHPAPSSLSYPVHQHPAPSSFFYPVHQHPAPSSLFYPVHQHPPAPNSLSYPVHQHPPPNGLSAHQRPAAMSYPVRDPWSNPRGLDPDEVLALTSSGVAAALAAARR